MTGSSAKVDDIFREAGTAFNKLSEMTMSLHTAEDSLSAEVWSPEDLETLRSSVHRFAVELNKISQHIKIRTMFNLRQVLEMDSGAIRDIEGSLPNMNQTNCTPTYIIQSPSVTSRATWLAYDMAVSTAYVHNSYTNLLTQADIQQTFGNRLDFSQAFFNQPELITAPGNHPNSTKAFGKKPGSPQALGNHPTSPQAFGKTPDSTPALGNRPNSPQAFGKKPDSTQPLGNHPKSPQAFGKKPDSTQPLGNHPKSPQAFGNKPDSTQALSNHPNSPQAFRKKPDSTQALGNHPNSPQAIGKNPDSTQALGNHPNSPQAFGKKPDLTQALSNHPNSPQAFGKKPNSTQALAKKPEACDNQPANPVLQPTIRAAPDVQAEIQRFLRKPLPVLSLLDPTLAQLAVKSRSHSPEEQDISENELAGFNPEVVPPVPPEEILQPEKRRKIKQNISPKTPSQDDVNNNNHQTKPDLHYYFTVQKILRYLNFENSKSNGAKPKYEAFSNEMLPSLGFPEFFPIHAVPFELPSMDAVPFGPELGNNAVLPLGNAVDKTLMINQNNDTCNVVDQFLSENLNTLNFASKQNNRKIVTESRVRQVSASPKPGRRKREPRKANLKLNKPRKQISKCTINKSKQTKKTVTAKKETCAKGKRAQKKQVRGFIKSSPIIQCHEDDNACDFLDAKEEQNKYAYAEHIVTEESCMPIAVTKTINQFVSQKVNIIENKFEAVKKHDPFVFDDSVEPAPDPLSTFRARWCIKKNSLKISQPNMESPWASIVPRSTKTTIDGQPSGIQSPAICETGIIDSSEIKQITPIKSLKMEGPIETFKTVEAVIAPHRVDSARVTRSKSRQGELLTEPLLPPKRSRRATKKTLEK